MKLVLCLSSLVKESIGLLDKQALEPVWVTGKDSGCTGQNPRPPIFC